MDGKQRVPSGYLALFASLYALQGVVVAYFFNYNLLYMMAGGVSKADAADAQSLALLPFILKFLGGPLSDRFNLLGFGHRKPYIMIGLVVQSLGLLGLSLIHPASNLAGFTALALLTVAGLALYDTCCDGMVIDVTPPADRDRVQGMLVASRAAAAMLCTLGFGFLLEFTGNGPGRGDPVLWICAALGIIPLIQAFAVPEPRRAADAERFQWRALSVLLRPRSLVLLAFGAFYALVGYGVEVNLGSFYNEALALPGANHRRPRLVALRRPRDRCSTPARVRGPAGAFLGSESRSSRPGGLDHASGPDFRADPGGAGRGSVRSGQRLGRCGLLCPCNGGVGPAHGRVNLCPVHGGDQHQRRRRLALRPARGRAGHAR